MNELSESFDKKSFFIIAAYAAQGATDEIMFKHFSESIKKYQKAKDEGAPEEKLATIYREISVLSYVELLRTLDRTAEDLISNFDNIDRVFDLITPKQN